MELVGTLRYILDNRIILRAEPQYYESYVAYKWDKSETYQLDKKEYMVLRSLYDQPRSINTVTSTTGIEEENCKRIIQTMHKKGILNKALEKTTFQAPRRVPVDLDKFRVFPVPFLSAPVSVDLFITDTCNLRCSHCFSHKEEAKGELSLNEIKLILDQFESLGVFEVRLNGGEPFTHPDIEKILGELSERRIRRVIITNGTLLDWDSVELLKKSRTIPTVSLDDSIPEGHDEFRGVKGAFERTVRCMKMLKESGVIFGVNTCVHRGNMKRIKDIVDLTESYGASKVAFLDLKILGRMKEHQNLALSPSEYRKLAKRLKLLKSLTTNIEVSLDAYLSCYPLKESMDELKGGVVSCSAAKTRMSIGSDGGIYPCNTVILDPAWKMGDIRKEELLDIWFSDKWFPLRGGIKFKELEGCPDCDKSENCIDLYCRLYPYVSKGDLYAINPYCKKSAKKGT